MAEVVVGRTNRPAAGRWTEGRIYTAVVGVVLTVVTTAIGLPPALRAVDAVVDNFTAPVASAATSRAEAPTTPSASRANPPAGTTGLAVPLVAGSAPAPAASNPLAPPSPTTRVLAELPGGFDPRGVAVSGDRILVSADPTTTTETPALFTLAASGIERTFSLGSVDGTNVTSVAGVLPGGGDEAFVLAATPPIVIRVDLTTGTTSRFASVPDVPPCVAVVQPPPCEPGVVDHVPGLYSAAFDRFANLFITDSKQGAIWRVPPEGGTATQWLAEDKFLSPLHDGGPAGIQFDAAGNLVFVVTASGLTGEGLLVRQQLTSDGRPGDQQTLATLATDTRPTAVALDEDGRSYVTLTGADAVAVFDAAGTQSDRLPTSQQKLLHAPRALVFDGRSLLVTSARSGETPPTLLAIEVGTRGLALYGPSASN